MYSYKDFAKLFHYKHIGVIKKWTEVYQLLFSLIIHRIVYFSVFLLLPTLVLPVSFGTVLLLFVAMHITTGITLSLIFQTAHVMPDVHFLETTEEQIDENWFIHQVKTTSNYSASKLLSWFIGGLNYQVEHHLFPHICHVHYPEISKIIRPITLEFGLPYNIQESSGKAIAQHFGMLRYLGK